MAADPRNQILVHQLGDLPALAHLPQLNTAIGRSPFRTSKLRQAIAEKKNSPDAVTEPKQHSVGAVPSIVSSFAGSPMAVSSPIVASHRQSLSQIDATPVVASATPQSNRGGLVPMQVDTAAALRGLPDVPDIEPPSTTGSATVEQAAGNGPTETFGAPPESIPAAAHADAEMARYLADGYEDNIPPPPVNQIPDSLHADAVSKSSSRSSGSPMQMSPARSPARSRKSSTYYDAMDIDTPLPTEPPMPLLVGAGVATDHSRRTFRSMPLKVPFPAKHPIHQLLPTQRHFPPKTMKPRFEDITKEPRIPKSRRITSSQHEAVMAKLKHT